ncbi:hypothetical protein Ccr29_gp353 [Caulobacter phage Ccr29]|nr:hypothetical protein Ccr10_gp017 [Caulobacter phage Ccr10]ARB13870.1 hypothetical protein Ccr10_gp340 [Caulobacter phage Ccr10]ARB14574.1 hypothetical protein Ccr29_gp017 [Caulobacter phage Ccr29]ARB14909.1 hypothetical protein Ccr29_gp353 [Caulobacter phage Ccr29]
MTARPTPAALLAASDTLANYLRGSASHRAYPAPVLAALEVLEDEGATGAFERGDPDSEPTPGALKLLAGMVSAAASNEAEIIAANLTKSATLAEAVASYDAMSDLAAWLEYQGEDAAADEMRGYYLPLEGEVNAARATGEALAAAIKPDPDAMSRLTQSLAEFVGPSRALQIVGELPAALNDADLILVRKPKEA